MKRFSSRCLSSIAKSGSILSRTPLVFSSQQHVFYSKDAEVKNTENEEFQRDDEKRNEEIERDEEQYDEEYDAEIEEADALEEREMELELLESEKPKTVLDEDEVKDSKFSPYVRILLKNGTHRAPRENKPVLPEEARMHTLRPLPENWLPQCQHIPPTSEEVAFNVLRIVQSQDEPTTWSIWNEITRRGLTDFFQSRTKLRTALKWLKREGYLGTRTGIYVRANMCFFVNEEIIAEKFLRKSKLERFQKQCYVCKTVFDEASRDNEQLVDPEVFRWSKQTDEMICLNCKDADEERYTELVQRQRAAILHRERLIQEREQLERLREEDPALYEEAKRQRQQV